MELLEYLYSWRNNNENYSRAVFGLTTRDYEKTVVAVKYRETDRGIIMNPGVKFKPWKENKDRFRPLTIHMCDDDVSVLAAQAMSYIKTINAVLKNFIPENFEVNDHD